MYEFTQTLQSNISDMQHNTQVEKINTHANNYERHSRNIISMVIK